ncbi:zinc finger MYM-type protein 1-like [Belonocnema kinseyi]|uniref:zinc finger MYM-type protein 1-like n=1 Tax=Belonocnema kinseyi TaxID=2817044 RepID=UPI00143E08DE|nr:zinc finger MYM-type protein 1-like [Belonocnema kinseyi]
MSKKVFNHIVAEIKEAKYFALITDSTPDISHEDQLPIICRYCLHGQVYERFLQFLPISSHTGESLCKVTLEVLEANDISISNCRGQSYDNASNMSGKYVGVQARIQELNLLALYVPRVGHSLNLVGKNSVNVCIEAISFFGFIANLYAFFVASPHRWEILLNNSDSTLESLSKTRWSCRDDATSASFFNYSQIYDALSGFVESDDENADTRFDARNLKNQMEKLEIAFMTQFWHEVLDRFNKTSKFLQTAELDLVAGDKMLQSLTEFINEMRNKFDEIQKKCQEVRMFC